MFRGFFDTRSDFRTILTVGNQAIVMVLNSERLWGSLLIWRSPLLHMNLNHHIPWDEVEDPAGQMFRVWSFQGELKWAKECWEHFEKAGLTSREDLLEETKSYLRLIALAKIYEEFSGYMWDENPRTPISYFAEELDINPIALAVIAKEDPDFEAGGIDDEHKLHEHALEMAVRQFRGEIHGCLADAYGGENALYSRMARTTEGTDLEENPELADDMEEFSATVSHSRAWSFVSNAFQDGY
jgi:hypothetical protein